MCLKGVVPEFILSVFTSACADMPHACPCGPGRPFVTRSGELDLLLREEDSEAFLDSPAGAGR